MSQNNKWAAWQSLKVKTPEIKNIEINNVEEPVNISIPPKQEELIIETETVLPEGSTITTEETKPKQTKQKTNGTKG